jgi:hypothetical protein
MLDLESPDTLLALLMAKLWCCEHDAVELVRCADDAGQHALADQLNQLAVRGKDLELSSSQPRAACRRTTA